MCDKTFIGPMHYSKPNIFYLSGRRSSYFKSIISKLILGIDILIHFCKISLMWMLQNSIADES